MEELRTELQANRHKIFRARSTRTKEKYKAKDLEIRDTIRQAVYDAKTKPDEDVIEKCRAEIEDAKKCREAVAAPDWYEEDVEVQADLFAAFEKKRVKKDRNKSARDKIDAEIAWAEQKIKDELKKAEKSNVTAATQYAQMVAGWDPYDQNASSKFFDAEWMFNIKDGFDVVIGNPPYISSEDQQKDDALARQRKLLASCGRYKTLNSKWDLYIPFMECGLRYLLAKNGVFAMIVPHPLTTQIYAKKLRAMIVKEFALKAIVNLNGTRVFESAVVTNCIPIISKVTPVDVVSVFEPGQDGQIKFSHSKNVCDFVQDADSQVWNLTTDYNFMARRRDLRIVGDYCYVSYGLRPNSDEKIARGTFRKEDLISDTQDEIHPRAYIEGKDIEPYVVLRKRYLEYGTKRSPSQLVRPTFDELYEYPRVLTNAFGDIVATYDVSRSPRPTAAEGGERRSRGEHPTEARGGGSRGRAGVAGALKIIT